MKHRLLTRSVTLVAAVAVLLVGVVAVHFWILDRASAEFDRWVDTALSVSPVHDNAVFDFFDNSTQVDIFSVCVVPPYALTGQLSSVSWGLDSWWLGVSDGWIGLLALDKRNRVVKLLRVSTQDFRIANELHETKCFAASDHLMITIDLNSPMPNDVALDRSVQLIFSWGAK